MEFWTDGNNLFHFDGTKSTEIKPLDSFTLELICSELLLLMLIAVFLAFHFTGFDRCYFPLPGWVAVWQNCVFTFKCLWMW